MSAKNGKLWAKVHNDEIEIRSLINEDLEQALDVLDDSFFKNECVSIGSEINLPENSQSRLELRELCRIAAADGVSIVAKHAASGKVVAVAFNKIQFIPEGNEQPFFIKFRNERAETSQAQSLMDFMISVDGENDVFELFDMDCVCELMFLATHPDWERKSIGKALTAATIELTRNLVNGIGKLEVHPHLRHLTPRAVTAIFTSSFSQKIGHALEFKVINTVPYTQFSYNGKTYKERINNTLHEGCEHVIYIIKS